jgi:DNA-binding NarL/FixJ family response regulator
MNDLPRVLSVENNPVMGERIRARLERLSPAVIAMWGVKRFQVEWVRTATEAKQLLEWAAERGEPYDALLLDLGLPDRDPDAEEDPVRGLQVLAKAQKESCAAAVIHTVYTELQFALTAIRAGIADYVLKDEGDEPRPEHLDELSHCLIRAYRQGLGRRWSALRLEHLKRWLVAQSRAQVADRLAGIVSSGIGTILAKANRLGSSLRERYRLSPETDPDDPLCRTLQELKEAALKTKQRCADERPPVSAGAALFKEVCLEEMLDRVFKRLQPGFGYYGVWPEAPAEEKKTTVHTFEEDIEQILQEMIFGALEASKPEPSSFRVERALKWDVARSEDGLGVSVSLTDQAPALPEDVCLMIEKGVPLEVDAGRGWGLSLAQRVAHGIGAQITPRATDSGNTVTLYIPVTAYDEAPGH